MHVIESHQSKDGMNRITFLVFVVLAVPLSATAGLFGLGDSDKVATEVAVLDEDTQAGTLDFSPDGRYLAVDSYGNGGTDIWDVEQKRIVSHLPEGGTGTWYIELIRFNPNSRQLAICHGDQGNLKINIDVYDTSTWTKVHSIGDAEDKEWMGGGCAGIAFTPDGKELIRLAHRDIFHPGNNVMFYDTSTWKVTRGIRTMPFVDSNAPKIAGRIDINNWSLLAAPDMLLTDPGNNKAVFFPNTLSISSDGKYLALAGLSYTYRQATSVDQPEIVIVELSNRSLFHVIAGNAESIDWNPDSVNIAAGLDDRIDTVKIFNSSTGEVVALEANGPAHVIVRYTPDSKYLIEKVGKQVEIWDGQHQRLLQVIKANPSCIAVSGDGHYFAMGGAKNSILDATAMLSLITHPNGPSGKVIIYRLQ